jgi:hypothetical protein
MRRADSPVDTIGLCRAKGDRHIWENTDGKGFLPSLRRLVELRGPLRHARRQGAARAIGVELALTGRRSDHRRES